MARTKVCTVSSGSGTDNASYRIPADLYDGLYRNEADYGGLQGRDANHWLNNRWWTKRTGRYPTIPNMLSAGGLTDITSLTAAERLTQMNSLFAEEYTGDIFAGRLENGWVTYNPYQYDDTTTDGIRTLGKSAQRATGTIPFQYNTCTNVSLDYAPYSLGIMKEYASKVTFYLQNYEGGTDIIKIEGASTRPAYTANGGTITESWANNVYTLTVEHSGAAVSLTINCSGTATSRQTNYTTATITTPTAPAAYTGVQQYEAELADYKTVTIQKSGYGKGYDGYCGQGYATMTSSSSALRYHVNVPEAGYYLLTMRYWGTTAGQLTASANGKNYTLTTAAVTEWTEAHIPVKLTAGQQTLDLSNSGGSAINIDCIQLEKQNISPFNYSTVNGEYHADFGYLTASGHVTFNAATGEVSVPAKKSGSLTLLLDAADFSSVTNVTLSKTGGDVFNYLSITDPDGNRVNSGNFWSSKYNVNYANYQTADASRRVYRLEWVANTQNTEDQSMTISDIVVKVNMPTSEAGVINETDGVPAVIASTVTTAEITYTRTVTAPTAGGGDITIDERAAKLYTVCLPYKPTTAAGIKYYTLDGVSDGTLVFTEAATVSANTPYLVAVTQGSANVGNGVKTAVDFTATVSDGEAKSGYQLKGTLRGLSNAESQGYYILQTGNLWGCVPVDTPSVYIPPFRAYIEASNTSGARMLTTIKDSSTGISHIVTKDADGTARWYDLNGRRIEPPSRKGIYIKNGKKIVVK